MVDLYASLGLSKSNNPSTSDIKTAYRKLAKQYHPDKAVGKTESEMEAINAKFVEINRAHEILSNPARRTNYDRFGITDVPGENSSNMTDHMENMSDYVNVFQSMFGGRGGRSGPTVNIGPGFNLFGGFGHRESCVNMQCTLEEIHGGVTKTITLTSRTYDQNMRVISTNSVTRNITLLPHWKTGTLIRYPGTGDVYPGQPPLETVVRLMEAPHQRFDRKGDNLIGRTSISLRDALCGFHIRINDIGGKTWEMVTGAIVSPQSPHVTIEGAGMHKKGGGRGDMIINCDIVFPSILTDDQKAQLIKVFD